MFRRGRASQACFLLFNVSTRAVSAQRILAISPGTRPVAVWVSGGVFVHPAKHHRSNIRHKERNCGKRIGGWTRHLISSVSDLGRAFPCVDDRSVEEESKR